MKRAQKGMHFYLAHLITVTSLRDDTYHTDEFPFHPDRHHHNRQLRCSGLLELLVFPAFGQPVEHVERGVY